jgi:hypothetical protein
MNITRNLGQGLAATSLALLLACDKQPSRRPLTLGGGKTTKAAAQRPAQDLCTVRLQFPYITAANPAAPTPQQQRVK